MVAALLFVLGVAGLVFGLFFARPMAIRRAIESAAEHGVELEPRDVVFHFGRVTLLDSRFRLKGLPAIHGTIRELDVSLRFTEPVGVRLEGVDVEAVGTAPSLVLGVSEWAKRYPQTFRLPTEARDARLTWRKAEGAEAWLTLSGGNVSRNGALTQVTTEKSVVGDCATEGDAPCPDLGKIGAAWSADEARVVIGLGVQDPSQSPVRIEVAHALDAPTADITLAPVEIGSLRGPFGVDLPLEKVKVSATVHLGMPKGLSSGEVTGTLDATLDGYIPPHPRELDGFVFGSSTTLKSKLKVDDARERVDLSDVTVTAGAFKLAGTGSLKREEDHGRIELDLKGNLPCSALAGAAVDSYLGKALGGLAGELARQMVKGSVGVSVGVSARSDDLKNAKVTRNIGVGCGIKPIKIGDFDIGQILDGKLPPLPSSLPGLPPLGSALPPLPKLKLEVEPPKAQDGQKKKLDDDAP